MLETRAASDIVHQVSQGHLEGFLKLSRDEFERRALEHLDTLYRIARRLTRAVVAGLTPLPVVCAIHGRSVSSATRA